MDLPVLRHAQSRDPQDLLELRHRDAGGEQI